MKELLNSPGLLTFYLQHFRQNQAQLKDRQNMNANPNNKNDSLREKITFRRLFLCNNIFFNMWPQQPTFSTSSTKKNPRKNCHNRFRFPIIPIDKMNLEFLNYLSKLKQFQKIEEP